MTNNLKPKEQHGGLPESFQGTATVTFSDDMLHTGLLARVWDGVTPVHRESGRPTLLPVWDSEHPTPSKDFKTRRPFQDRPAAPNSRLKVPPKMATPKNKCVTTCLPWLSAKKPPSRRGPAACGEKPPVPGSSRRQGSKSGRDFLGVILPSSPFPHTHVPTTETSYRLFLQNASRIQPLLTTPRANNLARV